MFGKKKSEESPRRNDGRSAEQKMAAYAFREAVKWADKDPEVRRALIAHFIGNTDFQPDDSVKRAIGESRAETERIRADNARIEAELRRKALDKIISSPELTDRWVKAEIERQTAIRSPDTEKGDQNIEPRGQDRGHYISLPRQALNILDALQREGMLNQQGSSSGRVSGALRRPMSVELGCGGWPIS